MSATPIPITILTGFLGAGKTTLLLSLLSQLPAGYKLCLLKNEFGEVAVDSLLAQQGAIAGVNELLNGCICCNLVGQLGDALISLKHTYKPSRIVIETSGSAFPATLAMEVNRVSRDNGGIFILDGVIQVIDTENFAGYADTSYAGRIQADYTDLIVLNKCEIAGEERVDRVLDRIRDVAPDTPVVRAGRGGWVAKDVVLGIDASLARHLSASSPSCPSSSSPSAGTDHDHNHSSEVDVLSVTLPASRDVAGGFVDTAALLRLLAAAPKDEVYRIKGVLRLRSPPPPQQPDDASTPLAGSSSSSSKSSSSTLPLSGNRWVLNWAFGRWQFTALRESSVVTAIRSSAAPPAPIDYVPDAPDAPEAFAAAATPRKSSIEVLVETSIYTVVEDQGVLPGAAGDCARLSFVLARGEGQRWLRRLQRPHDDAAAWIRHDRPDLATTDVRVDAVVA